MKPRRRRYMRLWGLLAITSALIVTTLVGSIVFSYNHILQNRYNASLRQRLQEAMITLQKDGFTTQTADALSKDGFQILLQQEHSGEIYYLSGSEKNIVKDGKSRHLARLAKQVQDRIDSALGSDTGSFFSDDADAAGFFGFSGNSNYSLMGRMGNVLFVLNLPISFSSTMLDMAVRYVTIIGLISLALSLLAFYIVAKAITWPHKQMAAISARIAEMDFSQKCPSSPVQELNELSDSINAMSEHLQKTVGELQNANEQLREELVERQRQQKLTTDLLTNLSHDLKTPIAVISGYAEGLLDGIAKTPEQQARYYDTILRESEHMHVIVAQMLSLSRLESGVVPVSETDFDLAELMDEVLELFDHELNRRGLRPECSYPKPIPVHSDYDRIRQCAINNVQNAIFHINGGTKIRIYTEDLEDHVRLCVENSSAPIPEEEAALIWEKLYRGDPARQRNHGEAGIGLCIVRGNMELLGQGYGFDNLPEEGTVRFWLALPKADQTNGR